MKEKHEAEAIEAMEAQFDAGELELLHKKWEAEFRKKERIPRLVGRIWFLRRLSEMVETLVDWIA